jgi:hypothetical protein
VDWPFTTPEGSDANMFIQWKGTEVCLDFHCPCGAHCHLDSGFAYFVQCPHCDSIFEMGTQVIAKRTTKTGGEPKVMEPDEDMPTRVTSPGECPSCGCLPVRADGSHTCPTPPGSRASDD